MTEVTNKPVERDEFIKTDCAGEVIRIADWYEWNKATKKIDFYFLLISFYNNMFCRETSWNQRFSSIWKIITTGTPYSDEILLKVSDAKVLRDRLTERIERAERIMNGNAT